MVMRVMKEDLSNFKGPWWCEVSSWGYQTALHYLGTIGHNLETEQDSHHKFQRIIPSPCGKRRLLPQGDWIQVSIATCKRWIHCFMQIDAAQWFLVDWLSVWFCDSVSCGWCSPTWDSKLFKTLCSEPRPVRQPPSESTVKTAERTWISIPKGPKDPILNRWSRTVHRVVFFFNVQAGTARDPLVHGGSNFNHIDVQMIWSLANGIEMW